jgi:hypothetical protein
VAASSVPCGSESDAQSHDGPVDSSARNTHFLACLGHGVIDQVPGDTPIKRLCPRQNPPNVHTEIRAVVRCRQADVVVERFFPEVPGPGRAQASQHGDHPVGDNPLGESPRSPTARIVRRVLPPQIQESFLCKVASEIRWQSIRTLHHCRPNRCCAAGSMVEPLEDSLSHNGS